MLDGKILEKWNRWINYSLEDTDLYKELLEIKDQEHEIVDRFYKNLEFGTGGLRGLIGVGTNRVNLYTVAQASQGYANYLKKKLECPSIVIAYDSRIKSDYFAMITAEVFAANGIKVFIFRELMPTPSLSFAVRYLNSSGGVVLTASHNPSQYNGYKVYGSDGCQITTTVAKEILEEIWKLDIFTDVKRMDFYLALDRGIIEYIKHEVVEAYIEAVSMQALCRDRKLNRDISIVYTPLNGAGLKCVTLCLRKNGYSNISVVKEQELPDGNFPTCPYPNPEIQEALKLGLRDAKKLDSDLVLATDPDCDRVGIAVKGDGGKYILFTGNEIGIILLDYICRCRISLDTMPEKPIMIKTIVTTDMATRIANHYGVDVIEVLTGFKYIGEQIGFLESKGNHDRYILGFEESYGYLTGSYVRDKDGVNASLLICEMVTYYKMQGKTLSDVLEEIYIKFGYCLNTLHSYQFEGTIGYEKMQRIMKTLRMNFPRRWCNREVIAINDYQTSCVYLKDGSKEEINLPKSNVLKVILEGDISVVIRPSGTEPKLKIYLSVSALDKEQAKEIEQELVRKLELLLECV